MKKYQTEKTKLNLGSGKNFISDFLNVDLRRDFKPDIVADIREIDFNPETFQEILFADCLDHFNPIEGRQILRNCYRWLKPSGIITVHTPNLRFLASILAERDDNEALKWMYGTDGEGTTNYPENVLRWSYSSDALAKILEGIGFTIIKGAVTCNGFGFQIIAAKKNPLHKIEGHITSQFGEDGIIDFVFSKIGVKHKTCCEIGYDAQAGNNIDLLVDREGWLSLVMDMGLGYPFIPKKGMIALKAEVLAENVNDLMQKGDMTGEIDLLSLDVDGNDYWIWKALTVTSPRVVIVEYNSSFGPDKSITVKYNPHFNRKHDYYHGASLKALTKLANEKGYALIGVSSGGTNAFYVKRELLTPDLPEVVPEQVFISNVMRKTPWQEQWMQIKDLDFEEV